ncbi:MAG: putative ATP-binding protein involved in virulence, partial [Aureispira sp.]
VLDELNIDLNFEEGRILHYIKFFINNTNLLPNNANFIGFDLDGNAEFADDDKNTVNVYQMSDGYRSILSLTFELIRQLIRVYGEDKVFQNIKEKKDPIITLPGVVLIDEVDVHLHPTWQIKIGYWFTKFFPQIQFIVSTHSPLVCRASEKGSIWRLGNVENEKIFSEVKGIEKDRLIYGNILDAYGTELFGASPVRSPESNQKLKKLGQLNMLFALNNISEEEIKERNHLLKILSTDDPTGY